MFGNYLQNQANKINKKITLKKIDYSPYHIPIDKINAEKPIANKIKQQCEKYRSKLNFIQDSIIRQGNKKRTCLTSTLLKNHNNKTENKQKTNFLESKQNLSKKKSMKINLNNLTNQIIKKDRNSSASVRRILIAMNSSCRNDSKLL